MHHIRRFALVVVSGAVMFAVGRTDPALAQSCGGCAAPVAAGGGAQRSWLEEGGFTARLSAEYEVKDRTFRGHRRVVNDFEETLRVRRLHLGLRYGLTDDWTLGLDLSDPEFRYRLKPPGGSRADLTVRGPGDSVVRVGRKFDLGSESGDPGERGTAPSAGQDEFRSGRFGTAPGSAPIDGPTLTTWAGLSLPTGDVKKPDATIVTRDFSVSNLQTGTGTFDPVLQARIDVPYGDWRFFADASAILPLAENRHDYRTAQTLAATLGAELDLGAGFHARLAATFQRVGNDQYRGDDVAVGGGKWVYLTPGLAWDVSESATLDVGVRCVLLRDADSKIVDSGAAVQVGLTLRF